MYIFIIVYNKTVESELESKKSPETYKNLLFTLLTGNRNQNHVLDHEAALRTAEKLIVSDGRLIGMDKTFITSFCQNNYDQIKLVCN